MLGTERNENMVKVGILTYHRSLNYGAVMQAYYLAEEIKKRFPDVSVEIVDYMSKKMNRYYKMITLYRGKESLIHLRERIEMYKAFQKGWDELPLSDKKIISDDYEMVMKNINGKYDILISGSDAVWNFSKRGIPNPYFLIGCESSTLMSYAASCNGLAVSSFSDIASSEKEYLKKSFSAFKYIGVRDAQTEMLVKYAAPELKVYHNCDPSLLAGDLSPIDRKALIDKLKKKYRFDPNKPTIAFMMSNLNGNFRAQLAKKIKEKYGEKYQTVSLYSYNKYADIPYVADLTPQEWSIIFGLFQLTISKYFHGTMFSLLNRTPVIAVSAEKSIDGMPNKISDALERMQLSDFYFSTVNSESVDWTMLMNKIDECLSMKMSSTIKNRISCGLDKERRCAESFFVTLGEVIADRRKSVD